MFNTWNSLSRFPLWSSIQMVQWFLLISWSFSCAIWWKIKADFFFPEIKGVSLWIYKLYFSKVVKFSITQSLFFFNFFSLQCFDNRDYIQRQKKMIMKNTLTSTHPVTRQNQERYFSAAFRCRLFWRFQFKLNEGQEFLISLKLKTVLELASHPRQS